MAVVAPPFVRRAFKFSFYFLCGSIALPTNNDLQIPQATQFELPISNFHHFSLNIHDMYGSFNARTLANRFTFRSFRSCSDRASRQSFNRQQQQTAASIVNITLPVGKMPVADYLIAEVNASRRAKEKNKRGRFTKISL